MMERKALRGFTCGFCRVGDLWEGSLSICFLLSSDDEWADSGEAVPT